MQTNHETTDRPQLPSREPLPDKPSIPAKPNTLAYTSGQNTNDPSLYCESHPIYANSSELLADESSVAYSEGSITPTNPERSASPTQDNLTKNSSLSASTLTITRTSKPPPPPPVRRTSTISNPNAITIGTLKSAGVNTYEEIQNLSKTYSTYEDINKLTLSLQNLSSIDKLNQSVNNRTSDAVIYSNSCMVTNNKHSEYQNVKTMFEGSSNRDTHNVQTGHPSEEASAMPLPAPPPEAFSDSEAHHSHHYNKITNVHRQFLETLNTKWGQFKPESHLSPRMAKRRSISLSGNRDDDWNSDSGVANRTTNQSHSIQQTLMSFVTGNHSRSSSTSSTSSSRHRRQSPESRPCKKAALTLASCDRESLMASLNQRLAQRQQNEIAKAAAAHAMQRKQSIPDINESHNNPSQNHYQQTYCSQALSLSNVSQSASIYQSIGQLIPQQVQQQQQQTQQQQIYQPVLHQQQLQRRSSQPTMGIKIINTTARQTSYETSNSSNERQSGTQGVRPMVNRSNDQQLPQQTSHSFSSEFYTAIRHNAVPNTSESNNNSTYNSSQVKQVVTQPVGSSHETFETAVAARVNSWFNSVHLPQEVKVRRESLMDQIRRGKQLRKVPQSNDRSAPKLA